MSDKKIGRWWVSDERDVHRDLNNTADHIEQLTRARRERDKIHMRLYCPDVTGNAADFVKSLFSRGRSEFSLIKQAVDTVAAQIATQRPKPQYIVTEGTFDLQRVARLRTKVLEGQLYDCGAYEIMPLVFIDALVLGTGHIAGYLDPETDEPRLERCMPGEILVDPRRGANGKPDEVIRRRAIARDVIKEMFPDGPKHLINTAASPTDSQRGTLLMPRDQTVDEVLVTEAWYAPGDDGKGGKHVIALSNCTLVDEDWDYPIPIVPVYWQRRQAGYWGVGIAEQGEAAQDRLDRLMQRIEHMQHLGSTAWVMVDKRAKVRVEQLSNAPLTQVQYEGVGNPPVIQVFNASPEDLIQEVDRIRERFLSMMGISVMAAEAKKPAGVNSGAGQRTYEDITSQRHMVQARAFEASYMAVVEMLEHLNARAQELNSDYTVAARTQRGLVPLVKQVKWSDAHLPPEQYRLTCFPTSQLPNTVSGRLEALSEWVASGFISRPYAQKQAIDAPDDDMQRLELADIDFVMWQIEEILDGNEAYPEPYQNLQLAADVARRAYLQVKAQGAPEEILQALRDYVDDCTRTPAPPAQPAMPPDMSQPVPPDAMAGPLPGQAIPPGAIPA